MPNPEPVELQRIGASERTVLDNLFQLYLHDRSAFFPIAMPSGKFRFDSSTLDVYWHRPDCYPYWIIHSEHKVGFVLLNRYSAEPSPSDIEQFFVLRAYRRRGIGEIAFEQCLSRHPGAWQIRVMTGNHVAYRFWHQAIARTGAGQFSVAEELERDLPMHFFRFKASV